MGYRFNDMVVVNRVVRLRNINVLLTGKKVIVEVAELDRSGRIEMLDAISVSP